MALVDGPFTVQMKEMGIEPPNLEAKPEDLNIDWFKWRLDFLGKGKKKHIYFK